jgi:hypothetical protein
MQSQLELHLQPPRASEILHLAHLLVMGAAASSAQQAALSSQHHVWMNLVRGHCSAINPCRCCLLPVRCSCACSPIQSQLELHLQPP